MTHPEIEAFLSICRHKNISKAAEELYIAQSSLSARLKALEDSLGCRLLLRGKGSRGITLTAEGQAFYQLALQYQDLTHRMQTVGKTTATEKLRVSSINSVGNFLLPPVFQAFQQSFPQIRLTVQDMEAELACVSILRGTTDLAFSTSKVQTDQIVALPFLSDPMVVLCDKNAPYPQQVTLEQLLPHNEIYIMWCADYEYWHQSVFGPEPAPFMTLELMGQIAAFLTGSPKWVIAPQSVADSLLSQHPLRQCAPLFSIPRRTVYMLCHRDNADSNTLRRFRDTLKTVLSGSGTQGLLL